MWLDDKVDLGKNIKSIKNDDNCTTYIMTEKSGKGSMKAYNVFPGIVIMYNNFNMSECHSSLNTDSDIFCIEHCKRGRIEWEFKDEQYMYLGAGDFQVNKHDYNIDSFQFPLHTYSGITISCYLDEASNSINKLLDGFSIDLRNLKNKFCQDENLFIMRADKSIEHIFSELYTVPESIRDNYFKIKVLELLLFLDALEIPKNKDEKHYLYRNQVEKVKKIKEFITSNLDKHFTINELSEKFSMSLTSMKTCFKIVYGMSIYSYIRSYKMNIAAKMISDGKENISIISGKMGYDNSSKFAAAFKLIIGKSPQEYRKSFV
ncbi:AraC family transcriptional regulator [Clostridium botulinum]|uniref:helix-turn-helix domain-containing protein n=1 Tax=Clostridium botulinum TaxID=1491 RepID=UPI0005973D47|nr:AraC family transcriptional regulator [Clostridium botulinum]KIL07099.1 AraC family transcriptional regulator [Clostridium botulinum]MBY6934128.1 helix-turn-helix transcriptional regulator [Clostridium botulinum]NFL82867.1 helix-turn-helix transcriptional regulator [Clostridium botulinum]NFN12479.1 helix-turn-helix transcriptional regulator [Clostridium botulinum]NFO36915.1 helix-turn-helix transcriptional regulator [Clostridium botulinum]